jgi:hypothetical protein
MSFLRHGEIYPFDEGAVAPGRALAHRLDEFRAGYSSAGCTPAVKYQTWGLDKTVRNKDRVNWSGPFGGGKQKADGSLVLSQARPAVWSRVP